VIRSFIILVALVLSLFGGALEDSIKSLVDEDTYNKHHKLIAILFEDTQSFMLGGSVDSVKVAKTLEENGLLNLILPESKIVELSFAYSGENPLFFVKSMNDTLQKMGISFFLIKEAKLDKNGFLWTINFTARIVPDPVLLAKRLAKYNISINSLERLDNTHWFYRVDMSRAVLPARELKAGESFQLIRPIRPVWFNVSKIKRLILRERPGSHWYADVVVYDKMLHILSMKQNDTRTRYMNLKLPPDAVYVKVSDRFTLENLKSGLQITAKGEK
jgi:hypothetical protein